VRVAPCNRQPRTDFGAVPGSVGAGRSPRDHVAAQIIQIGVAKGGADRLEVRMGIGMGGAAALRVIGEGQPVDCAKPHGRLGNRLWPGSAAREQRHQPGDKNEPPGSHVQRQGPTKAARCQ